ncbi:HoxN/HupN/NixA family nickel/cobalt transporter [Pararhodobacter oceanensis]|uniref:HoxN/HupN/NixA family nickel/cobalt transporter n=1 Tax=Pararhodobacter oceanensis TaxID=2172121 RepID=UPI003A8CF228
MHHRNSAWPQLARPLIAMGAVIIALLAAGWGLFFGVVLPGNYLLPGGGVFSTGLAITAFTLGLRHGFDPDHIAAIDNVTRKLMGDGGRPVSVGFWFALGHSSVVIVTVALLAAGLSVLARELSVEGSSFTTAAGIWGLTVSSLFLVVIGLINLTSLAAIWEIFRGMRQGRAPDTDRIDDALAKRGLLARLLGPVSRRVDAPWKMFPVGVLFGLGFDTATTIALFAIGGTAALTAPWYVVLVLPILFTAGITLVDTLNGVVMQRAYAWAYAAPLRRIYYNFIITLISVAVAFLVGGLGLLSLTAQLLGSEGGALGWIAGLEFENLGYLIVGVLVLTWLVAVGYWKLARLEARFGDGDASP